MCIYIYIHTYNEMLEHSSIWHDVMCCDYGIVACYMTSCHAMRREMIAAQMIWHDVTLYNMYIYIYTYIQIEREREIFECV